MSTISPDPEHCTSKAARCSRATEEASVWIGKKKTPATDELLLQSDNQVGQDT